MELRRNVYAILRIETYFFSFSELNKEDGVDVFIPMEPIHFEDLAHDSYRKKSFKSYNRTEQGIYNKKKEPVWLNHLDSL